jgi:hypothetical protein
MSTVPCSTLWGARSSRASGDIGWTNGEPIEAIGGMMLWRRLGVAARQHISAATASCLPLMRTART